MTDSLTVTIDTARVLAKTIAPSVANLSGINGWIAPVCTLIGVFLGAVLSNWLGERRETRKLKRSLRPELVKTINIFFNLRKATVMIHNGISFQNRMALYFIYEADRPNITQQQKDRFEQQYETSKQYAISFTKEGSDTFAKLMECEGNIYHLLSQIEIYIGKSAHKKVFDLIKPHIDRGNKSDLLYKYEDLTTAELLQVQLSIENDVQKVVAQITLDSDTAIDGLNQIRL
jgi:hypothetical protein